MCRNETEASQQPHSCFYQRGIRPSQGRYLHTEQHKHRINAHRHQYRLEWDSKPRPQCSSGRRHAIDRAAKVIGFYQHNWSKIRLLRRFINRISQFNEAYSFYWLSKVSDYPAKLIFSPSRISSCHYVRVIQVVSFLQNIRLKYFMYIYFLLLCLY
jgi:hypothetical protein